MFYVDLTDFPLLSFRKGDYCTKFIPEEYPNGFSNVDLVEKEKFELIASAIAIELARNEHLDDNRQFSVEEEEEGIKKNLIAVLEDKVFEVSAQLSDVLKVTIVPTDNHHKVLNSLQSFFLPLSLACSLLFTSESRTYPRKSWLASWKSFSASDIQ